MGADRIQVSQKIKELWGNYLFQLYNNILKTYDGTQCKVQNDKWSRTEFIKCSLGFVNVAGKNSTFKTNWFTAFAQER